MKRILPPTYLLLAIAAMVGLHFLLPGAKLVAWPWGLLGIAPFTAGVVVDMIADRAFKIHGTTVKPFEESSALLTDGVYGFTRHPMYLGFVLILLGIAVFMGSATPFAVIAAFAVLMDVVFIRAEERMMEAKFGERWATYTSRTRRWM